MTLLAQSSPAPVRATPTGWEGDPESPRFGRFVLGPELGRGGMGQVHLAWDPMLRRHIAIKRLLHADPLLTLRFMREAQTQAKVEHPRICKVFEVGSEADQPYIAMQFIQGLTLGETRDNLNLRDKVWLMAEIAGAIHAAHRQGLIHRDLKPSNILLELQEDGSWAPFILDFGLARDQSAADLTLSWGFVGTPAFMSPEQANAEEPTPASDVYSLGATFYALFAGHPPYEATTLIGLLAQQAKATVRPLHRTVPGLPKDLDTILLKCLETDPAARYPTAFELEEDLRRWLAGEPIRAKAIGPLGRGWRRIKRHKALSLAIAGGLALALALTGWNLHAARRSRMQVELAQRFGLEVREVEQLLRIERMLPVHDIRPAEAQVRQRMDEIRSDMARLGPVSAGPGHYALGRGHLTLREFPSAQKELEEAWRCGFRSPEVAYAQGVVLMELFQIESKKEKLTPAIQEALDARYARPALAHFAQAKGQVQEDPALGEAQVALLRRDYPLAVRKCREAFTAKPWMYEAKLLEARAWNGQAGLSICTISPDRRNPQEGFEALEAMRQTLETAQRIAPSDEQIYSEEIQHYLRISVLQTDSGRPEKEIFPKMEALYQQALAIRPGDLELEGSWLYSRVRHGFDLLRRGEDVRPLMRESRTIMASLGSETRSKLGRILGDFNWLLADGEYRRGGDPFPVLAEMERWYPQGEFTRIQPTVLRAEALASHGKDPRPAFDVAEKILRNHEQECASDFYFFHLWGMTALARAEWEWDQGSDPLPSLEEAAVREAQSCRVNPNVVYSWFYLARAQAHMALRALSRREDPEPSLKAALRSAQEGAKISTSHYGLFLTLGRIHYIEALDLLSRRQDPEPATQEARAALKQGLALNPTDFRLHLTSALVELAAARHAIAASHAPQEFLARAEAAAQRGLGYKSDCAKLWLVLARSQRLRAEWALAHGEAAAPCVAEGLKCMHRALALHPNLAESLAEKAMLEGIQGGKDTETREKLARNLKRNPFLELEYRLP